MIQLHPIWTFSYGLKNNTSQDSLFMYDPSTSSFGWRDFSERKRFGNIREWGYSVFVYTSDFKIYQDGIEE